jgi:hypothetical protein
MVPHTEKDTSRGGFSSLANPIATKLLSRKQARFEIVGRALVGFAHSAQAQEVVGADAERGHETRAH